MLRLHPLLLTTAVVGASGSIAAAEELGTTASTAAVTTPATDTDTFVLPKGKLLLNAFLEMNLSSGAAFKPVSLSPDLWYGVNDDVTIGVVHSTFGRTGFLYAASASGDALCLTGSDNGCAHVYNNLGIDGRIRLSKKPFALDVGLYVNSFADPFQLAAKVGIDGRWNWSKVSLEIQPAFFLGLTNRGSNNTETLSIPATLAYSVAPKADLALQAGLMLPFTNTSDTWAIPLAIAARYAVTPQFGLGLAFAFPTLIGGKSTANLRTLTLGGTYAF